jgi:hypothetical protein
MAKAKKIKQLSFSMPDRPGLLTEITAAVSDAKVNINAICAYAMDNNAFFMLITDSNARTKKALAKMDIQPKEEDVIAVEMPNVVGSLQKVAKRISDAGVNINYMYGTTGTGKSSVCIFSTSDDKKAIKAINK